jgi:2-methylfumaryl-CoA isomerase
LFGENTGPLAGLRIVDMSSFVAGPSCTLHLAQLGADVIRIDPLSGPADAGRWPLAADGSSLYWAGLNKQKRVLRLDLRAESGRDAVRALLAAPGGGVLVSNALGQDWLAYDTLLAVRPDLVMVQLQGRSDGSSAIDYTVNCATGLPDLTGPAPWSAPVNSVLPSWDLLAGAQAATALLAALDRRRRTGRGALLRISLTDVAAATLAHLGYVADAVVNDTHRERDGNSLYGSYGQDFLLADGRRIMVVALTRRHWRALVDLTGIAADPGWDDEGERYRRRDAITALLAPWFAARPRPVVAGLLDGAGVPWGDYRSVHEMSVEPDGLVARSEIFTEADHPGVGRYPIPGAPARSDWTVPLAPVPRHTEVQDVLREWQAHPAVVR